MFYQIQFLQNPMTLRKPKSHSFSIHGGSMLYFCQRCNCMLGVVPSARNSARELFPLRRGTDNSTVISHTVIILRRPCLVTIYITFSHNLYYVHKLYIVLYTHPTVHYRIQFPTRVCVRLDLLYINYCAPLSSIL